MSVAVVSDDQLKNLILLEVNDTVSGPVGANIDTIWAMFSAKALIAHAPLLQYQYALKKAIEIMVGYRRTSAERIKVDGVEIDNTNGEVKMLQSMLDSVCADIKRTEELARAQVGMVIGNIIRTAAITRLDDARTVFQPDPNKRDTAGDPLLPIYRRGVW